MQLINQKNQSGAVLVVSLIILLVLTIVVMSANQGVVVQERLTNAVRETNLVFQTAESTLVEAEAYIETLTTATLASGFSNTGANGLYAENYGPADYTDSSVWATGKFKAGGSVMSGYSSQYIIESLGEYTLVETAKDISLSNDYNQPDVEPIANVFRIVVRAVGPNGITERIIAGYYSVTL